MACVAKGMRRSLKSEIACVNLMNMAYGMRRGPKSERVREAEKYNCILACVNLVSVAYEMWSATSMKEHEKRRKATAF